MDLGKDITEIGAKYPLNCTAIPEVCEFKDMSAIISPDAPEDIYISPVGCYGIIRRKQERNLKINPRLEEVLLSISSQMPPEEIEKRSRIQKRGKFSTLSAPKITAKGDTTFEEAVAVSSPKSVQLTLFDCLSL